MHTYRTHTCGELRLEHAGSVVRLSGWLRNRRDHGGVYFIDLADHYGVTQLVVAPGSEMYERVTRLPKETVIRADGTVVPREEGKVNPAMATGEVGRWEAELKDFTKESFEADGKRRDVFRIGTGPAVIVISVNWKVT